MDPCLERPEGQLVVVKQEPTSGSLLLSGSGCKMKCNLAKGSQDTELSRGNTAAVFAGKDLGSNAEERDGKQVSLEYPPPKTPGGDFENATPSVEKTSSSDQGPGNLPKGTTQREGGRREVLPAVGSGVISERGPKEPSEGPKQQEITGNNCPKSPPQSAKRTLQSAESEGSDSEATEDIGGSRERGPVESQEFNSCPCWPPEASSLFRSIEEWEQDFEQQEKAALQKEKDGKKEKKLKLPIRTPKNPHFVCDVNSQATAADFFSLAHCPDAVKLLKDNDSPYAITIHSEATFWTVTYSPSAKALTNGWLKFANDCQIEKTNRLLFEVLTSANEIVLRVHIFRPVKKDRQTSSGKQSLAPEPLKLPKESSDDELQPRMSRRRLAVIESVSEGEGLQLSVKKFKRLTKGPKGSLEVSEVEDGIEWHNTSPKHPETREKRSLEIPKNDLSRPADEEALEEKEGKKTQKGSLEVPEAEQLEKEDSRGQGSLEVPGTGQPEASNSREKGRLEIPGAEPKDQEAPDAFRRACEKAKEIRRNVIVDVWRSAVRGSLREAVVRMRNCAVEVIRMLPSHVGSCFWLGTFSLKFVKAWHTERLLLTLTNPAPSGFSHNQVNLVCDRRALSGGWRTFALEEKLQPRDAVCFERVHEKLIHAHIFRREGCNDMVEESKAVSKKRPSWEDMEGMPALKKAKPTSLKKFVVRRCKWLGMVSQYERAEKCKRAEEPTQTGKESEKAAEIDLCEKAVERGQCEKAVERDLCEKAVEKGQCERAEQCEKAEPCESPEASAESAEECILDFGKRKRTQRSQAPQEPKQKAAKTTTAEHSKKVPERESPIKRPTPDWPEAKAALQRADKKAIEIRREGGYAAAVVMRHSHVCNGKWLGGLSGFGNCWPCPPNTDRYKIELVNPAPSGHSFPVVLMPAKSSLSGGWGTFSSLEKLKVGDAICFEKKGDKLMHAHVFRAAKGAPDASYGGVESRTFMLEKMAVPKSKDGQKSEVKKSKSKNGQKSEVEKSNPKSKSKSTTEEGKSTVKFSPPPQDEAQLPLLKSKRGRPPNSKKVESDPDEDVEIDKLFEEETEEIQRPVLKRKRGRPPKAKKAESDADDDVEIDKLFEEESASPGAPAPSTPPTRGRRRKFTPSQMDTEKPKAKKQEITKDEEVAGNEKIVENVCGVDDAIFKRPENYHVSTDVFRVNGRLYFPLAGTDALPIARAFRKKTSGGASMYMVVLVGFEGEKMEHLPNVIKDGMEEARGIWVAKKFIRHK